MCWFGMFVSVGLVVVLFGLFGVLIGLIIFFVCGSVGGLDVLLKVMMIVKGFFEFFNAIVGGFVLSIVSIVFAGLIALLVNRHVKTLRAEVRTLLVLLTTYRGRLRLRVGDEVLRAPVTPKGYRVV